MNRVHIYNHGLIVLLWSFGLARGSSGRPCCAELAAVALNWTTSAVSIFTTPGWVAARFDDSVGSAVMLNSWTLAATRLGADAALAELLWSAAHGGPVQ